MLVSVLNARPLRWLKTEKHLLFVLFICLFISVMLLLNPGEYSGVKLVVEYLIRSRVNWFHISDLFISSIFSLLS